jgi:hypothetical protein|tara:strand:- start:285 stop:407 length:123 start_codon:yes stop_codon:yes gene_type:complete
MNEWDEYIDAPDFETECRCCGTQTNGDTYCSNVCYNLDIE